MKKLSCGDAGIKDCNYEMTGNTDDEIMEKAREHGRTSHNLALTPEQEKKVRTLIKSV